MLEEALAYLRTLLPRALAEDIGDADVTTEALAAHLGAVRADVTYRNGGIVAGIFCIEEVLAATARYLGVEPDFAVRTHAADGQRVAPNTVIATVSADAGLLLPAERSALNFLAHMSGVATLTARFVEAVGGTRARIYDTRKTVPLLRALQKYAVKVGGGCNHRRGLYDQALIKDNHLKLAGVSIGQVVKAAADYLARHGLPVAVEVEVENIGALEAALAAGAHIVMLDNMSLDDVRRAVGLRDRVAAGAILEVSGGVSIENVRAIAETGVERISVGALTHSAAAADIAIEFRT